MDRGGIDFSLETATCKVFASELGLRAANEALQIAGGLGYSKEYPYERAVRDSRITGGRSWIREFGVTKLSRLPLSAGQGNMPMHSH